MPRKTRATRSRNAEPAETRGKRRSAPSATSASSRLPPKSARKPVEPSPKGSKATSAWQFETGGRKVKAFVPTECPLCGSKQLVVRKPDSPAKVVGKVAAGLVVPLVIEFQARANCKVCGWRSEGTY